MNGTWIVEIVRTVRVTVPARDHADAKRLGNEAAWEWLPSAAENGYQGTVLVRVVREGDQPGDGGSRD